jgi:Tol biopolymer transport system component
MPMIMNKFKTGTVQFFLFVTVFSVVLGKAQSKEGSPLDQLPSNMEILTSFGERADISPDNKRVAFMEKSYGDAYVIDLATRQIRCITCGNPTASYLRVMHLSNGDYILIGSGAINPTNIADGRELNNKLWYLSQKPGSKPVDLHQKVFEGMAISKKSMKISFSESFLQYPEMGKDNYKLFSAELSLQPEGVTIINKKMLTESHHPPCKIEPQDFYDNDKKLIYTCYGTSPEGRETANVEMYNLETGATLSMTNDTFHKEPEGIFPDNKHILVESDIESAKSGEFNSVTSRHIDLYKLKLDGTGKDFVRMTNFNDYKGYNASNPVVATNGKFFVFQVSYVGDIGAFIGAGHGLIMYRLNK